MGAIFDSNDDITGYQCVECTSIIDPNTGVAWVSGGAIDCSITAIESEFCGTNMYPSKFRHMRWKDSVGKIKYDNFNIE